MQDHHVWFIRVVFFGRVARRRLNEHQRLPPVSSTPRFPLRLRKEAYNRSVRMIGVGTARVKFVAAMFVVAMFYGSVCAAACAAGFCPLLGHGGDADQCHHQTSSHPGSHDGLPDHSGCATHGHPTSFVTAAGPTQFQFAIVAHVGAPLFLVQSSGSVVSWSQGPWGSDLAPPVVPKNPLYQQMSALRI